MYDCPGEESSVNEDPPWSEHPAQPELLLGWPPETGGFLILIRAGLCCKKKRLPLLLWCLWSVIQQEPKLLYHTGNCLCCVFSSTCLNLISLDLRQLLFSPFHPRFTHTLQYLGNGTSVFDKPRNVPLCIASAEQGLSGEGLPFCPNMFPELLSKFGESRGQSPIGATSMHFWFYLQTLTVCSGLLVCRTRRNAWPGSSDCPFNNQPHAVSDN